MALAAVLVERPRRDDAALALLGQAVDPGGDAREQRVAAAVAVKRVGAGTVDHGPHDLRPHVLRDPGRRHEPVVAAGHAAGVDLEAVSLGAGAAHEALVEDGSPEPAEGTGRSRSLGERRRRGRRDAGIAGARLRDERLAVEQQHPLAVLRHGRAAARGAVAAGASPRRRSSRPGPAPVPPGRAARWRSRRWPRCVARGTGGR